MGAKPPRGTAGERWGGGTRTTSTRHTHTHTGRETLAGTDRRPPVGGDLQCEGRRVETLAGADTHDRLNASKMLSCCSSCTAESRQREGDDRG